VSAGKSRAARLAAGAGLARGDWLLFLLPQTALEAGWENEAESFMASATLERPRAASFRFALDDFEPKARRREAMTAWRTRLFALPYAEEGLLIPRRLVSQARRLSRRGDGRCGFGAADRTRAAGAIAVARHQ